MPGSLQKSTGIVPHLLFLNVFLLLPDVSTIYSGPHSSSTSTPFLPLLPTDYQKSIRPNHFFGPTLVGAGFHIVSFGPVSSKGMSITNEIYVRCKWNDSRLKILHANLTNTSRRAKRDKSHQFKRVLQDSVFLAGDYYNQIWKPDLYFPDAVELKRPIIEADDSLQLQVDKDGNFLYSMRLIVQTRCSLRMTYFPLDQQECPICISHYKYPVEEQSLSWFWDPINMSSELSTPHFYVENNVEAKTSYYQSLGHTYINLCAHIKFKRKLTEYFIVMYCPSFILTGLSFLNFWLDKRAVPARASLSITSILAQITLMTGVSYSFPSGSDLKIIDVYLIVNFFFTVCTIIEFTIVSYKGAEPQLLKQRTRMHIKLSNADPEEATGTALNSNRRQSQKKGIAARSLEAFTAQGRDIDVVSRYIFTALFIIWNIGYFITVFALSMTEQKKNHRF
ncbi:glycine receptor subunit alpha-2-like isoform X2 [Symsagittifera roscoffensis]|uniref:glycine receptor subunit alpha-2-like isoform X2 n=1 Tax=Symsagittifera roscoffensis TaxID=84072 RepID=UPI00307BF579